MKITTIDAYIDQCPPERQLLLNEIRTRLNRVLPDATETMKYGMPTYFQIKNLIHFANAKQHIGIYPTPDAIIAFEKELRGYKTSKGAIQFPVNQPIPYDLIEAIAKWRLQHVTTEK